MPKSRFVQDTEGKGKPGADEVIIYYSGETRGKARAGVAPNHVQALLTSGQPFSEAVKRSQQLASLCTLYLSMYVISILNDDAQLT
jgi:hypothetical protein